MRPLLNLLGALLIGIACLPDSTAQVAPSIALVVPKLEGGYVTPASPVLYATAGPGNTVPPSSIVAVDFLDGGTVIGSVTAPNSIPAGYAFVWQNAPPGMHLIAARATDSLGYSTTTSAVTVYIVGPDPAPIVNLTTPSTGQIFAPPNGVQLAATASSPAGTIQRVEFVTADRVIATALSPPYAGSWSNPPAGNFAIVAKAYDDVGVAATSPAAYVQVLSAPRVPAVVLTAPAPGITVTSGNPVPMAATALAPDGSVGRVDFYAGPSLLGSVATAPYQFTWTNPAAGAQSLLAKAYDLRGIAGVSAAVPISVTSNRPPNVVISSPANNAQFSAAASIVLSANASDSDGTVVKVDYFANGVKVASAAAPFSVNWSNVRAGTYALYAVATDNLGATATSPAIAIAVVAPPPTVTLTAPQSGSTYAAGQEIVIAAHAVASQRSVSRVEFYGDGKLISTAPASGSPSVIDVNYTWTGAAVGTHALSAKVFTADGSTATSANVSVSVVDFGVALGEPFAGQVYQAPGDVRITANPSDPGGTITQVDFYGDGVLLGSRATPPYTFLWSGVGVGAHTVSVKARDATSLTASSAPLSVSVIAAPTLQVDAGIDGSTIADDNASVSGTVQAPQNSALNVNGRLIALDGAGRFFVDGLPLIPGLNSLSLELITQDGTQTSKSIALNSAGVKPFQVSVDRQEGIAPLDVTLTIAMRGSVAFQWIEIDANSDGVPETKLTSLPNNVQDTTIRFAAPGTYSIDVKVFDTGGTVIYSAKRRVLVWDPASFTRRAIGAYSGTLDRLRRGDIEGALTAVSSLTYDKYKEIFSTLQPDMPTIVDQLGTIQRVTFGDEIVQLLVARPGAQGAAFSVEMIRGSDGIWRIEGM